MKRKILMTASTWGHIRSFHLPYLRELQRRGWETHVACPGIPTDAPCVDAAIEVPFEKKMTACANLRAAAALRRAVKAERYDLIVAHTTLAAFFTRLAVKGLRGRPPLVDVVHGYLFDDGTPAPARRVLLAAERFTAPETDLLLTMNAWDDAAARKYRLGKRVERIPGVGVDFARLDAATTAEGQALRAALGFSEDAFVLLFPAEFSENKSQRVLIEALRTLPETVVLALPGSGALLEDCKALAERLGVGARVRFPGYVNDIAAWYRVADAAAAASRKEGLPFNVMEAMHCGLPVVASAVKGHTDLIADGETGLLYPYGDADAFASRVRMLLADGALRRQLAANARAYVERYGLDAVFDTVMEQYEAAAGSAKDGKAAQCDNNQ